MTLSLRPIVRHGDYRKRASFHNHRRVTEEESSSSVTSSSSSSSSSQSSSSSSSSSSFSSSSSSQSDSTSSSSSVQFNPAGLVGWTHFWWVEGAEMIATSPSNGSGPSSWPDEIGSEDLAAGVNGAPIYYSSKGPNGKPALYNYGRIPLRFMDTTFASSIAQPLSVVAVYRHEHVAPGTYGTVWADGNGFPMFRKDIGENTVRYMGAGSNMWDDESEDQSPHITLCYFNGSSSEMEVDGEVKMTGNAGTQALDGMKVTAGNGSPMQGYLCMIGVYEGDVRDDPGWGDFLLGIESHYAFPIQTETTSSSSSSITSSSSSVSTESSSSLTSSSSSSSVTSSSSLTSSSSSSSP